MPNPTTLLTAPAALAPARHRCSSPVMIRPLCLSLLLALPLPAQALPDDPGWPPGALLAALSGDWNGNGEGDLAVLVDDGEGSADLLIHEGDHAGMVLALHVPGVIVHGGMGSGRPQLSARSDTSFAISQDWLGIGRTPWTQSLTIAHRGGAYVLAGFTHEFADRLDPARHGRCDVNLLSGRWEGDFTPASGQPTRQRQGQDGPRAFPVNDMTEDYFPQVCLDLFAE